jgi:hypothetical protein
MLSGHPEVLRLRYIDKGLPVVDVGVDIGLFTIEGVAVV